MWAVPSSASWDGTQSTGPVWEGFPSNLHPSSLSCLDKSQIIMGVPRVTEIPGSCIDPIQ